MPFPAGSVTFKRFFVAGSAPRTVDQDLLDRAAERAIGKGSVLAGDNTETGWITGEHVLDTQFDFAKNRVGDCLFLAMRVDSCKPPSDVVRAYEKMHAEAILAKTGRDYLNKQERREAKQAAKDQAERDAKSGTYRRMRQFGVLWDLSRGEVYLGATSPSVVDRFTALFRDTFDCTVTAASSGELAARFAATGGMHAAYEDLRPAQFIDPPSDAESPRSLAPGDEGRSKDFLGTEWLVWLWYASRHEGTAIVEDEDEETLVRFEKALQLDCAFGVTGSTGVRADDPILRPEAAAALASGKVPIRAGLQLVQHGEVYGGTVRGDVMHFSGVQLPPVSADATNARVIFEERTGQLRDFNDAVEASYRAFLRQRLSSRWSKALGAIRGWIAAGATAGAGETLLTGVSVAS
ncbi:MAG: hypothetical protein JXA69_17210 [Phycisphaerae bacterium]|nr:hypothetical protein [Phycisphaerae bacterium]